MEAKPCLLDGIAGVHSALPNLASDTFTTCDIKEESQSWKTSPPVAGIFC
jgi:hypothetical protein